jgi:hypothetical protein
LSRQAKSRMMGIGKSMKFVKVTQWVQIPPA